VLSLNPYGEESIMCSQITINPDSAPNAVQVYENRGEWFVLVTRAGEESVTSFELESFANAFADGQRLGLGLPAASRQQL
jgi:hypothetical protein